MVIIKEWKDFDICRKASDRIVVVYGAGGAGVGLTCAGAVSPVFFLDQNAPAIKKVITDDKNIIPVITVESFISLKQDADIIVAIAHSKWDPRMVAEELAEAFSQSDTTNYIYYYNERDFSYYSFGGKIRIHGSIWMYDFLRDSLFDKTWGTHIRDAFLDKDAWIEGKYADMLEKPSIKYYFAGGGCDMKISKTDI